MNIHKLKSRRDDIIKGFISGIVSFGIHPFYLSSPKNRNPYPLIFFALLQWEVFAEICEECILRIRHGLVRLDEDDFVEWLKFYI